MRFVFCVVNLPNYKSLCGCFFVDYNILFFAYLFLLIIYDILTFFDLLTNFFFLY